MMSHIEVIHDDAGRLKFVLKARRTARSATSWSKRRRSEDKTVFSSSKSRFPLLDYFDSLSSTGEVWETK